MGASQVARDDWKAEDRRRRGARLHASLCASALTFALGGCQVLPPQDSGGFPALLDSLPWKSREDVAVSSAPKIDISVYQRVESERADRLEREVARLRADLRQAEQALVAAESGLDRSQSRTDVVSMLAQARIRIERASRSAPWRTIAISEARGRLDDADGQLEKGNFGAATFFVFSAKRIASAIESEVHRLETAQDARFIRGRRVNLRSGPSTQESVLQTLVGGTPVFAENDGETWSLVRTLNGQVGWIHASLLGTY